MKRAAIILASLLVLTTLIGVGIARTRPDLIPWTLHPGVPARATPDPGLYCKEHGVPEAFCTLCHEELKSKLMLCKEHGGIPEDICTLCHPELQKKHGIEMCPKGHGLPRHFCSRCGNVPSASLDAPDDGWCGEHNRPEVLCAECARAEGKRADRGGTASAARTCRLPLPVVRLASSKLARRVGIETALASGERHTHRLACNAEVAYDGNRYAEVHPRVVGLVREVKADVGQRVRRGDVLAVVDAAEVGSAKSQYLLALHAVELARATYDRTHSLVKSNAVAAKHDLETLTGWNRAGDDLLNAEQRLRNLGLADADLAEVAGRRDAAGWLRVVSPIDGEVVARHAVVGEAVEPTGVLFAVADTSRVWLWIDVYQGDLASVQPGRRVDFTIPKTEFAGHAGRVTWVGSGVNPRTRTTRVRAELPNPGGDLRDHQFGHAEVQVGDEHEAVFVPEAAVQRKDDADVVFIPQGDASYRPQRVTTRRTGSADAVEVTWGLKPGQRVVTTGAFLLKTEIMKGSIGAGCCD